MKKTVYFSGNTVVKPGETVLLSGSGLDSITDIEISRLPDSSLGKPSYIAINTPVSIPDEETIQNADRPIEGEGSRKAEILQKSSQSLKFIIPDDFIHGVLSVSLLSADSFDIVYVNQPMLSWLQGDLGKSASLGGWLRLNGEKLVIGDKKPRIVFEKDGKYTRIPVKKIFDAYSIEAEIPATLNEGTYKVYVSNGFGGRTAWSMPVSIEIKKPEEFPCEVFNVRDYGACGTGEADDTEAFRKALDAVAANNGGVLYIPRGRYKMTGTINVPDHTIFRGEALEKTQLYWIPFQYAFGELPEAYITAESDVTFENVEFRGTRVLALLCAGLNRDDAKNIIIRNVIADFNALAGGEFHVTSPENRVKVYNEILMSKYPASLIRIAADNIQITDSEFHNTGMTFGTTGTKYKKNVFFKNNKVYERTSGWAYFSRCENLILEDSEFEGCTVGFGGSHCYMARNFLHDQLNNDREALTTDMSYTQTSARMIKIEGTKVWFPEGIQLREDRVKCGGLFINTGKGAGQARRVVEFHDNEVTFDSPFAVEPDETSEFCFGGMFRTNYYILNNTVRNGGHLQFYCDQVMSVLDGNEMSRSAGVMLYCWIDNKGEKPGALADFARTEVHFVSVINNKISSGNYLHKFGEKAEGYVDGWSGYSSIGCITKGCRSTNSGMLFRGNTLTDNALLQFRGFRNSKEGFFTDMIVEENKVSDSCTGILFELEAERCILRRNDLSENVDNPVLILESNFNDPDKMIFEENKID